MNKNPFVPQPSYTPQQPPLPPGPPPPQPTQPDYSAYWAAAAAQQHAQPPGAPVYAPQWTAPQPARPPADQNALFANYGYGPNWQRQQQQQQRQQQQQQHQQFHPPPPPVAQPPPPAIQGYNPYQPAVGYPQPYVPQAPQPMSQPQYAMPQPPPQPQFVPHMHPQQQQQQPMQQQQQQRQQQHQPSHPPAKRQRFDGPSHNQGSHRNAPPSQPQFAPPVGPMGSFPGPSHAGGRSGNTGPMRGGGGGGNRGGPSGGGGGRGGRGSGNRGMGGRGGSFSRGGGGGGGNRGGGNAPLRSHGSRGNFGVNKDYHPRRGGGGGGGGGGGSSYTHSNHSNQGSSSFRGGRSQGGYSNSNRSGNTFGPRDSSISSNFVSTGKKDENRRTLTDFKMIGLEIRELSWSWGILPALQNADAKVESSDIAVKEEPIEQQSLSAIEAQANDKPGAGSLPTEEVKFSRKEAAEAYGNPPSRIRIYFHTPVTPDDSHPPLPSSSYPLAVIPSDSRKGKRKKLEDDDGDLDEGRAPPPPPHMNDDRASVADTATSEGDWLMAAIGEDADHEEHPEEGAGHHDEAPTDDENGDDDIDLSGDHEHGHGDGHISSLDHSVDHNASAVESESKATEDHDGHSEESSPSPSPTSPDAHISIPIPESSHEPPSLSVAAMSAPPVNEQTANHVGQLDKQVLPEDSLQLPAVVSEDSTLVDISITQDDSISHGASFSENDTQETQFTDLDQSQLDQEHLPEPPASSTTSAYGDLGAQKPEAPTAHVPSANRLSISYASGNRRLVIDAEVVNSLKLFRREGRIEIQVNVESDSSGLHGILIEGVSDVTKAYTPILATSEATDTDATIPPFTKVTPHSSLSIVAYLDTTRPLSEAKWAKTGDVQDWLRSMFGRMFWVAGDAAAGWEKKITVVDPDPPPTIWTVLDGWAQNSPAGVQTERQRFLKTHMTETDNVLEILLRLVRGERATPFSSGPPLSAPSVTGPLLSALSPTSAHGSQQSHVSLAVLAIFRMSVEYAQKAIGEKGKGEVEERVGEIIRCLPSHLIYKSLDGIFKEWRVEKKGR